MKRKTYPKYKPSGVEWLGDVPEHWEVKRLDFLATVKARLGWKGLTADEYVPEGFIFLATPNIKGEGDIDFQNVNYITAERYYESPEIMVKSGDVLMAKDGSTLGTTNVVKELPAPTTVNSSIAVLRPKSHLNSSFFFRWLTCSYLQSVIQSKKDGQGVPHLFQADMRKFAVLLPPLTEQRAIAAFLDRETGRIDALIAKKRELVERLKEKRTALISHTVTHGLPPDAAKKAGLPVNPPLRPSGVEWLGDIPEHWNTMSLKWHSRCHSGDGISTDDVSPDRTIERCIPVIGGNGVMGYCDRLNCNHQVLVIGRVGALCGNVHHIVSPAWITDNALVMQTDPATFVREYLAAVLRTRNLNELADKTAQPLITGTRIRSERVPVPPLPEQAAIAAYLDAETSKLDALISKLEETVERMQEYRTALITAAVTGKIDVRGNAIALRHV